MLQATLKLVAQIDHGLPGRVRPPGLAQRCHQLREPGLASLSRWHQVLARRSLLSGERLVERRAATDIDFSAALPARPLELKLDIIILKFRSVFGAPVL